MAFQDIGGANTSTSFGLVWEVATLSWVKATQAGGAAGGGDASAANQVTGNASLASIDGKTPALGQALAAASSPVVLTAIQVAALTPPAAITGFATATKQDTGNTSLASVDTKTPALGQALAASAVPVVLTAIQQTALTPPAAITGFALEAGHLAAIDTSTAKIPAQGQALAAASLPVVLTAIQQTALTPPAAITGFALEAGHLAAIDTSTAKIPAQGQALAAASLPVVLTAIQQTALTPPAAITGFALDATLTGRTQKTQITDGTRDGTVKAASTLPVATDTALVATLRDTAVVSGTVTVTPPTLTKGTQGATGFSTQDLKDAGRNQTNYFQALGIAATSAEVMQSLTGYKGGIAVAATATPAVVTAGKTYRVTSITAVYQSLATAGSVIIRLRANLTGVAVVGSPLVANWQLGSAAAVAGIVTTESLPFPEGLEFAAGTGIAIGAIGMSSAQVAAAAGFVMITITGYEY